MRPLLSKDPPSTTPGPCQHAGLDEQIRDDEGFVYVSARIASEIEYDSGEPSKARTPA